MNVHDFDGNWVKLPNGGIVEMDWCWRCDTRPVYLLPDPKVNDTIGVCVRCARARFK